MIKKIVVFLLCFVLLSNAENYKKDEVIVRLKDGTIHSLSSGKKISKNIFLLKVPENLSVKDYIKKLKEKDYILDAEPNYIVRKAEIYPNDYFFSEQWGLTKIEAPKAWDLTKGSNTIYVAVLDTGADYQHPDLAANLWINEDERKGDDANCNNGIDDDGNGYIDDCYGFNAITGSGSAFDDDGHGTHVSGIIGAVTNNSIGVAGTSWNVKIIPCKFLDGGGNGDINGELRCIQYIKDLKLQKNLNIVAVNSSYGGEYHSDTEKNALEDLKSFGIIVISAAGNDGNNNDFVEFSPCNYGLENQVCVGATNQQDERAYFSNYSKTKVHIYAPGENIISTYFDKDGDNKHIYAYINGTSQATPFVTGGVVLLKSLYPDLTYQDIKKKLLLTGDNLLNLSGYSFTCNRLNLYNLISSTSYSPKICLNSIDYDFGNVTVGETKEKVFTIRSTGEQDLIISQIISGSSYFKIKNDNCSGKSLKSLEECQFKISFEPDDSISSISSVVQVYSNTQNVEITVKGAANHAPEILSFSAEPDSPGINETVTFSWSIFDEDFDKLTCRLDFDGDGTIDQTVHNCTSGDTVSIKYHKKGEYKVKLFVSDGKDEVSKTIKVRVGEGDNKTIIGCAFSSKDDSDFGFAFILLLFLFYRKRECKKILQCNNFLQ